MFHNVPNFKGKILTYLWAFLIFVLSTLPTIPGESMVPFFHQIGHFVEFFVLTVLFLAFIFEDERIKPAFAAILFATFIEAYQYFLPWRTFEVTDLIVDFSAVLFGILTCEIVLNKANVINY